MTRQSSNFQLDKELTFTPKISNYEIADRSDFFERNRKFVNKSKERRALKSKEKNILEESTCYGIPDISDFAKGIKSDKYVFDRLYESSLK